MWVKDGAEAVARHAAERFDLILMDLSMPGMDGFATTALIRQRGAAAARVPIVALTAHDAANYRDACLTAGMDDMLSKPYTLEECAQVVRRFGVRGALAAGTRAPSDPLASVDAAAVATLRRLRSDERVDLYSKLVELFQAGSAPADTDGKFTWSPSPASAYARAAARRPSHQRSSSGKSTRRIAACTSSSREL